jgi:hypothetical protein
MDAAGGGVGVRGRASRALGSSNPLYHPPYLMSTYLNAAMYAWCAGGDARVADAGHGKEHETQMPQEEHQTHRA